MDFDINDYVEPGVCVHVMTAWNQYVRHQAIPYAYIGTDLIAAATSIHKIQSRQVAAVLLAAAEAACHLEDRRHNG